jgi:hypothetical protein
MISELRFCSLLQIGRVAEIQKRRLAAGSAE